ncbi:hypothetical protein PspLS_00034 [Pyricularia sp. CBS 133598]|nr:hypothetical protein PspLS_00034 [Pyricularia sp. CBS 133598]
MATTYGNTPDYSGLQAILKYQEGIPVNGDGAEVNYRVTLPWDCLSDTDPKPLVQDHGESKRGAPAAPPPSQNNNICGLRKQTFYIMVGLLALIVIAAAAGGGVGGSMAARNSSTSQEPEQQPEQPPAPIPTRGPKSSPVLQESGLA